MNKDQEAKLNMYNAVIRYCNNNLSIASTLPAFTTAFDLFKVAVVSITNTVQKQAEVHKGITVDKKKARIALAKQAAVIAAKVFAYATSIDSSELKERVNFAPSYLLRLKDDELPGVCLNILKAANENFTPLAAYNITDVADGSFEANIRAFIALSPSPRNAVSQHTVHSASLRTLFKAADDILKNQLDKVMKDFIGVNPDFYFPYLRNRSIVDPATTPTQIKGIITHNITDEPLKGVTITILETGTTVTTDAKGKFALKPLAPGTYSIKISKEGFQPKIVTDLEVKQGKIVRVDLSLSPTV